jgi:putative DNA methylase
MNKQNLDARLIESNAFPFEFLSQIGERESWRKEIHRPIYHVHKWWAKRLGSVFRGILLGSCLGDKADLHKAFYDEHDFSGVSVFDPFMGSGTTVGEAHKLGFAALGRDINPVAVDAVRVALGPMERIALARAYKALSEGVGREIRALYRAKDSADNPCDVLYYFWVMQAACPECAGSVDLFSSYVIAQNAYPKRKPEVRVLCPVCGDIFRGVYGREEESCPACSNRFNPARNRQDA